MRTLGLGLILGCAFIFVGRWVYRRPRRVYPVYMYNNPGSALLTGGVRIWGILLIFGGSYAALITALRLRFPDKIAVIISLLGACAAAWLLRPRVKPESETVSPEAGQDASRERARKTKRRLVLAASFGFFLLFFIYYVVVVWTHR